MRVCKHLFSQCFLSQKDFSSSVGCGFCKAEHDHENVAKSKAGRLKETRDRPLSLFFHDFKEDNVKEGASRQPLENHKGVASMVLASLFDGHPHCHSYRGNATEDSHVEQSHNREDF